jgi:hypothetical protein
MAGVGVIPVPAIVLRKGRHATMKRFTIGFAIGILFAAIVAEVGRSFDAIRDVFMSRTG